MHLFSKAKIIAISAGLALAAATFPSQGEETGGTEAPHRPVCMMLHNADYYEKAAGLLPSDDYGGRARRDYVAELRREALKGVLSAEDAPSKQLAKILQEPQNPETIKKRRESCQEYNFDPTKTIFGWETVDLTKACVEWNKRTPNDSDQAFSAIAEAVTPREREQYLLVLKELILRKDDGQTDEIREYRDLKEALRMKDGIIYARLLSHCKTPA